LRWQKGQYTDSAGLFEFSIDGHDRYEGSITFIGQGVDHIQLDHPDGQIILHSDEAKKLH